MLEHPLAAQPALAHPAKLLLRRPRWADREPEPMQVEAPQHRQVAQRIQASPKRYAVARTTTKKARI
jgi:hypothetical protein